jgi:tRNA(adenine34) deaminase
MTEPAPKLAPPTDASDDAHARIMRLALEAAERAALAGEVPVGAVIVVRNEIVATAHNERETRFDPTAHAEIVALRRAAAALGSWRLTDAELYVTMEPCPMCAGALVNARVRRVVYGCDDPKAGAVRTLYRILDDARLNHRVEVVPGVLAAEGAALLKRFFSRLRGGGAALNAAARFSEPAPPDGGQAGPGADPGARP